MLSLVFVEESDGVFIFGNIKLGENLLLGDKFAKWAKSPMEIFNSDLFTQKEVYSIH